MPTDPNNISLPYVGLATILEQDLATLTSPELAAIRLALITRLGEIDRFVTQILPQLCVDAAARKDRDGNMRHTTIRLFKSLEKTDACEAREGQGVL